MNEEEFDKSLKEKRKEIHSYMVESFLKILDTFEPLLIDLAIRQKQRELDKIRVQIKNS